MAPIKGDNGPSNINPPTRPDAFGVLGEAANGFGVVGLSSSQSGVYGVSSHVTGSGVFGLGLNTGGIGVKGEGPRTGVWGSSDSSIGVTGISNAAGHGEGVRGTSFVGGRGVVGDSRATSPGGIGVVGFSSSTVGGDTGVLGSSLGEGLGVEARSRTGTGLFAHSRAVAVMATNDAAPGGNTALLSTTAWAGLFQGNVLVTGNLSKPGGGFLIDHPDDPANKYLQHSFVESPERKNVYDGIAVLNKKGEAQVELPKWFAALNGDFRYQLTCLGQHAPVYIAQEIEGSRFRIAGGPSGLKVSWQVTGVRQDPWAKANPLVVEQPKPKAERGSYLDPALYDQPQEKSLRRAYHQDPETISEEALKRAMDGPTDVAGAQP
jgi:hypothetical protein